jgi:hypothetical protein
MDDELDKVQHFGPFLAALHEKPPKKMIYGNFELGL